MLEFQPSSEALSRLAKSSPADSEALGWFVIVGTFVAKHL
jgi:hypothetical protein